MNAIHPADCAQHVIFGKCCCGTWVDSRSRNRRCFGKKVATYHTCQDDGTLPNLGKVRDLICLGHDMSEYEMRMT